MSPASYQTAPPRGDSVASTLKAERPTLHLMTFGAATRAGNGTRTRDPNLGKVVLYQLSYSRNSSREPKRHPAPAQPSHDPAAKPAPPVESGGEGNRTPDLYNAIVALSQLSYAPSIFAQLSRDAG